MTAGSSADSPTMRTRRKPNRNSYPRNSRSMRGQTIEELITVLNRNLTTEDTIRKQSEDGMAPADRDEAQLIKFMVDDLLLAVPLPRALEIGRQPVITPLPNLPSWVLGVSNIRGEIISMVDLKVFFEIPSVKRRQDRRFIILQTTEMKVGIVVDRILGIFSLEAADLPDQDPLHTSRDDECPAWTGYISNTLPMADGAVLNILDAEKLLLSSRMNAFDSH
jgi:purine-binding chemotaxis protein CheW